MADVKTAAAKRVHSFYYDELGWCGCGDPEAVMRLMRDVLDAIRWNFEEGRDKYDEYKEKIEILVGEIGSPVCLSYFYVLDYEGLTEHGSGLVNGGWLTDLGREILNALKDAGDTKWDDNAFDAADD